jgi:hypothetical protein
MTGGGPRAARRPRRWAAALAIVSIIAAACGGPWIQVQNIGSEPAQVTVRYYDGNGDVVADDARTLAPGESARFSIGSNDRLPRGFRGSAVVESDQPVVALRRTDAKGSTGEMSDGQAIPSTAGGGALYLPMFLRRGGPFHSWSSRAFIQNMGDTTACVTLTYLAANGGGGAREPRASTDRPDPGDCPKGGMALAPRATLYRDAEAAPLPDGFAGAIRVDLTANAQGTAPTGQLISASVDSYNDAFNLLTSYGGLRRSDLATTVVLPLVEREVGPDGAYRTRFHVIGDASRSVQLQLHVEGVDGAGNPVVRDASTSFTGALVCEQAADDASNCLGGASLPPGFSGWARLTATSPIGVVVQRGSYVADFGSYTGTAESSATRRLALPGVRPSSWLRVYVPGGGATSVRIRYIGPQIDGGSRTDSFSVSGVGTVRIDDVSSLPGGFDGGAILESDAPIIVVAWLDVGGGGDHALFYNGVPAG